MVINTDLGPVLHKQLQCVYIALLSSHVQGSQLPVNDDANAIQVHQVYQDIKVTCMTVQDIFVTQVVDLQFVLRVHICSLPNQQFYD